MQKLVVKCSDSCDSIIYPQKLWVYQVDDVNYATGVLPNGGFGNTFLDALDGVRKVPSMSSVQIVTNCGSHIATTLRSMKQEMIQRLIQFILTLTPVVTTGERSYGFAKWM